jgi:radical SAM protein with 4Fe4S-binding SPASM domain
MLFRQKFDTFIRIYDGADGRDVGYITNRSDFGDRVVDRNGAVFLKALSRTPKSLEDLTREISKFYINVDTDVLKNDIIEFFKTMEEDGFIVSGETPEELDGKDTRFSYSSIEPKTIKKDFSPLIRRSEKSTQEYLDEHFRDRPHLTSLQIELTSRCNERCVHCYIPHENKSSDIDGALFYDVLEQCREMGLLSITLSGGEPLAHPNFLEFLRAAKDNDLSINVLSNLTLLNDEIISEMRANRLSSVQVSLYSMKPEIHDSITKLPGSFYKTRDAILKLIENDIPMQISCPVMKQNRNCAVDVLNWGQSRKIRTVIDYIMMARYDHSTGNLDNRLSLDEAGIVINDIINNDFDYQDQVRNADFNEVESRDISNDIVCGVCVSSVCMVANGNVYPCAGWQDYVVGNVHEQTLKDIWDNSPKVKYLRSLRKKDFPKCRTCSTEESARCECTVTEVTELSLPPPGAASVWWPGVPEPTGPVFRRRRDTPPLSSLR